jgi:putative chitinase
VIPHFSLADPDDTLPGVNVLTLRQLEIICPQSKSTRLETFVIPLNATFDEFGIDTPEQRQRFLAQIAHESGGFFYVRELASGEAYEGRADLGNTEPGDGRKFRGRGLIQITGRANTRACSRALFGDDRLLDDPTPLERPDLAARSAGWFWQSHGLGNVTDFERLTRKINGGTNGLADRYAYYGRAKQAIA